MSVEGHVRCGGCQSIFPKLWVRDSRTGAGYVGATPFCCQKCKGVILFRANVLTRARNPHFT